MQETTPRKLSFVEKVKGFLMHPINTFGQVKSETLGDVMKYYAVLLIIFSVLYGLILVAISSLSPFFRGILILDS